MGTPPQNTDSLEAMISELLKEPFAIDASLQTMSFEAAGKLLEEVAEEFVTNATEAQDGDLRASYDRCKALYISILMEAEANPGVLGDQPLGELFEGEKVKPSPPTKRSKKSKTTSFDLKSEKLEKKEETELPSQSEPKGPTDAKAREYWDARASLGASDLPRPLAWRFEAQCLAFALEAECRKRLSAGIHSFWKKRAEAMAAVTDLDQGGHPKAEMMDALIELGAEFPDWLEDGKLPESALKGALRFLSFAPSKPAYEPSLLETGLLLVLFGSDDPLRGWARTNYFGQHGLTPEELIEIFFRLMRVQTLRNRAMSSTISIESAHVEALRENIERTFELMDRIVLSDDSAKKAKKEAV